MRYGHNRQTNNLHGTKLAIKAYILEKAKNACILGGKWPNLSIFWMEQTRWFAYIRKPPRHLALFFGRTWHQMAQKDKKCKTIGTLTSGNQ